MRNRRREIEVRIGLKYCGGCSPKYDRTQIVDDLKNEFSHRVRFVSYEDPDVDCILIVAGCPTACVDREPFRNIKTIVVTSDEDYNLCCKEIEELL